MAGGMQKDFEMPYFVLVSDIIGFLTCLSYLGVYSASSLGVLERGCRASTRHA